MPLIEGEHLPDFALPDESGKTVTLADLKGRPFVLYFYPKDDTSGCTTEAIDFTGLATGFRDIDVRVLGISPDPVKKHAKFREKHDLSVQLLSDEEKVLLEACGVWIEKSMYGRKYMGVDRTTVLVDADGTIVRVWSKVKVPGHAQDVLEAAKAHTAAA